MSSPNVNFFISYVDSLYDKKLNDEYVKENIKKRNFYSANQTFDYVDYVNKGSKEKIDYISYSGNNEKSKGIFNEKGLMDKLSIKQLRSQLRASKSVIWHGLVSFTEDFGNKYCNSYEKAYELMKHELPKFFERAGLNKDNIIWYAGLHENTDNKHIHFSFFEKEPLRYKEGKEDLKFSDGFINNYAIRKTKESIELKLLNISKEIVEQRNILTNEFKNIEKREIVKQIQNLLNILPTKGRMSYESEQIIPFHKQIQNTINLIIANNPQIKKEMQNIDNVLSKNDDEIKKIYQRMNKSFEDKLLKEKYTNDLYRRLGNIVLTTVKEIRFQQQQINYQTKQKLIIKRIEKHKRKILFKQCERLNNLTTKEIINSFREFLHKLDEMTYKRLQEERNAYEET